MQGEIVYISSPIKKKNEEFITYYLRVNGEPYETYIVKGFRNAPRWLALKVGDKITGLRFKNGKVDADSPVKLWNKEQDSKIERSISG